MKAKDYNGTIKIGLPKIYHGIFYTYVGDFDKQSDEVHRAEGFYPIIEPTYDTSIQYLDNLHWDSENEVFTYDVIDKVFDLEEIREERLNKFSSVLDEFATLITRCQLINGTDNPELNSAIEQTRLMRINTINAINAIDNIEDMLAFKIRAEDVEYYRSLYEPYK